MKKIRLSVITAQYLRSSFLDPLTVAQHSLAQRLMKSMTKNPKKRNKNGI